MKARIKIREFILINLFSISRFSHKIMNSLLSNQAVREDFTTEK